MLYFGTYKGNRKRICKYLIKNGVIKNIIESEKITMYVRKRYSIDKFGVFGTYEKENKTIPILSAFAPNWIIIRPLRDWINSKILLHELGHIFGIEKHKNIFCLMFESNEVLEFLIIPFQLLRLFRFCKKCKRKFIINQSEFLAKWESKNI